MRIGVWDGGESRVNVTIFVFLSLRCRKDIRELFEHLAVSGRSVSDSSLTDSNRSSPDHGRKRAKHIGKSNNVLDYRINTSIVPLYGASLLLCGVSGAAEIQSSMF